jgi:O-antigen ligase
MDMSLTRPKSGPKRTDKNRRPAERISKVRLLFLTIAFGAGLTGFECYLLALKAVGLGDFTRQFTVPYRALFLAFSITYIAYGVSKRCFVKLGHLWIPLLAFWFLYLLRILMDGYLNPVWLGREPIEYVQKAIGVTLIPMFMFLLRLGPRENDVAFRAFWTVHIASLGLALLNYRDLFGFDYRLLRYRGVDASELLDSINLAYVGVIATVVAFQVIVKNFLSEQKRVHSYLYFVLAGGLSIMILSETRSAVVAYVVTCSIIVFTSMSKPLSLRKTLSVLFVCFVVGALSYALVMNVGGAIMSRTSTLVYRLQSGNIDEIGRVEKYEDAFHQFCEKPLFGSCLEEQNSKFHPHNNILEAFMATGVVGGLSFAVLLIDAVRRCLFILKEKRSYAWIACFFIVFLIRGLFSTPLISSALWYSMMAVFAVPGFERHSRVSTH